MRQFSKMVHVQINVVSFSRNINSHKRPFFIICCVSGQVYLLLIFFIFYHFQYDYKFISKHEVTSYRVKLLNTTVSTSGTKKLLQKDYYINCDGEVIRLQEPVFDVRLHRKAVTFFGDVAG